MARRPREGARSGTPGTGWSSAPPDKRPGLTTAGAAACRPACHANEGLAPCFSRSNPCFFPGLLGEGRTSVPPRHCIRGAPGDQPMRITGCQPLPQTSAGTAENLAFLVPRRHASSLATSGPGIGWAAGSGVAASGKGIAAGASAIGEGASPRELPWAPTDGAGWGRWESSPTSTGVRAGSTWSCAGLTAIRPSGRIRSDCRSSAQGNLSGKGAPLVLRPAGFRRGGGGGDVLTTTGRLLFVTC